ncbi:MAG: FAD-dependent oxidoreductase [Ideonella sp.]|nr:FAD-dependent oxidoreductase [Ideonella sp.]
MGTSPARGHRLREVRSGALPVPAAQRHCSVLIVGGGIAGLAAARAFARAGHDDVHLLELEDQAGGNSRGHRIAGLACPIGAHYLPLPGPQAREVSELLHELGLLRHELGRTVAEERHLCHSPQERLFIDGAWIDGLLPPAEPGSPAHAQYRAFAAAVAQAQRELGFALPSHRAPWTAAHQALDAMPFAQWLQVRGLTDARLRWYLDYSCRDDYGAPADSVSAWAGLHYFASRHGFHAPGDADGERDPVFTWPEGNAWLSERLARPLGDRLLPGRTVLQVDEGRHGVQVLAWDEALQQIEAWQADTVVLAVPLYIAARLLRSLPAALAQVVPLQPHAPWLVANLQVAEPLLQRQGAPPAWDNVVYGSDALGYVDATHQSLSPVAGATVLTAYHALSANQRPALLADDADTWAQRVVQGLAALHPDLPAKLRHVALTRHGHAMSIPMPGLRGHPALAALRAQRGRVRFAHADLAGYSVFEEAFTLGCEVALAGRAERRN